MPLFVESTATITSKNIMGLISIHKVSLYLIFIQADVSLHLNYISESCLCWLFFKVKTKVLKINGKNCELIFCSGVDFS